MPKKLLRINKEPIQVIEGQFYVSESQASSLVTQERFIPVYFASTSFAEVFYDSPALGMTEHGPVEQDPLKGPFFNPEKAEEAIEERKKQINCSNHDFSGKVVTKVLSLKDGDLPSEPQIYKYHKENYTLRSGFYPPRYGEDQDDRQPSFDVFEKQVYDFFQRVDERARRWAKELRELDKDGQKTLLAILEQDGPCFVELGLRKIDLKKGREEVQFFLNTFSQNSQGNMFYQEVPMMGINPRALRYSDREHISFSPVKISLSYDSVEDIAKNHDFILV